MSRLVVTVGWYFTPGSVRVVTIHRATVWPGTNPFWACLPKGQRWQGLPDDASNIPSSLIHSHQLDEVTTSGSWLIAFTPLLLTRVCQAHARGYCSHPTTWAVGFDDLHLRRDHLTNIGTQLQQSSHCCRSSPVLKDGFERTNRTTRLEPPHISMGFLPINGVPVHRGVGGCTSHHFCLRS